MKTLIIDLDKVKKIAEHAASELPKDLDADEYAKDVCDTVFEIILHQMFQKVYYDGLIAAEQRCNEQLKGIKNETP